VNIQVVEKNVAGEISAGMAEDNHKARARPHMNARVAVAALPARPARLARLRSRLPSEQPRPRAARTTRRRSLSRAPRLSSVHRALFLHHPGAQPRRQPIFGADCGALRREWRSYLTIPVAGGGRQTVMADTSRAPTRAHDASHSACARNGAQHMQPQHFGAIGGIVAMVVMVLKRHLNWQFFGSKSRRARIRFK